MYFDVLYNQVSVHLVYIIPFRSFVFRFLKLFKVEGSDHHCTDL